MQPWEVWVQFATILGATLSVSWIIHKEHREDIKEMDKRWQWLFKRTDEKLDNLRDSK